MNLGMVRGMLEQVGKRRRSSPSSSRPQEDDASSNNSKATQPGGASQRRCWGKPLSDAEVLSRAREAHKRVNFYALAAGPNAGGPWKRVGGADRFVIFRRDSSKPTQQLENSPGGVEVLCAGRLDASIEEVAAILCPLSEAEHNAVMKALYGKRFVCGSVERNILCSEDTPVDGQELAVKTSSFARSTVFGSTEQWCYSDLFERKVECDGFVISQQSLPRFEHTPGRIPGSPGRVDQLHDLTASYLVDLDPGSKGLRVVFNAKFVVPGSPELPVRNRRASDESSTTTVVASPISRMVQAEAKAKAQTRRLVALARGVTKITELVRCRRFGFQVPANLDAIELSNPRCPCCTRSLAPVKLSLSVAASAISRRSLAPLKMDTRRCYLCGYLVCVDCWSPERMESKSGRVACIVVCRRCQACVDACNYADISSDPGHGPARVVADPLESSTASLLVDFLADSLEQSAPGSPERSNMLAVVRTLLQDAEVEDCDEICDEERYMSEAVAKVDQFLRDEDNLPLLEDCTLGNADQRDYVLDLPDDPVTSVPRGPIPSNEARRLSAARDAGLLLLADQMAPEHPRPVQQEHSQLVDVRDLELICQLAVRTLGCSNAMISVLSASHEHVLASTDPNFAGAAVPRDYTMCQHQLMSQYPLVLVHPEADVRLQAIDTIKLLSLRSYIGFPITSPIQGAPNEPSSDQIAVGTLCCLDSKPHRELTRSQYATMHNLARIASHLIQQKGLQLQQRVAPASSKNNLTKCKPADSK
ncbi:hypothetical protein PHYPSEUDO_013321 [Phytophthora pseudosyringae]|uniref:GAF domain-containing protein n=1 Tax=Phytophthora pseudosyringae TaxID=221518 RepID=A0A8T1W6W3_9STRA|nr:hypothetical protein PHYPSEUDO_013321 [Phytophthora pseudosyringae]